MGCGSSQEKDTGGTPPREVKIVMLGNGGPSSSLFSSYPFRSRKICHHLSLYSESICRVVQSNVSFETKGCEKNRIEDSYRKTIKVGNQSIVLDILDTAG
jgi:hypothetical protein